LATSMTPRFHHEAEDADKKARGVEALAHGPGITRCRAR
jgi:hypothetical protein